MATTASKLSGRVAFTYPDFVHFLLGRWFVVCALEMQTVAIGWQVYAITARPMALGLVGLFQFLPGLLLFLVTGHAADRFDRKKLIALCYIGFAACSSLLLMVSLRDAQSVDAIYGVSLLLGVVRCFYGPAGRSILPRLVSEEHFPNAVAWSGTVFQSATILGPAAGGLIYAAARGPSVVYAASLGASLFATIMILRVKASTKIRGGAEAGLRRVLAGLRYIWREKLILGSISLDLFAVLLGGATALLPIYAVLLKTGPWGLGILRSAPGVGAVAMAILVAYKPIQRRAGVTMLWCVAGFGVSTILFGLSRSLALSLVALFLVGATDMVSVIVRSTLLQVATPDEMRGRVSAVDMIFVGASNELGQFESGLTANLFGTVPAVVLGGIGTLLVTALWAWAFPGLRKADSLTNATEREE
ncbi:MAG TPA: MFS transporter [Candidatus Aquilonibacter sp.]|nr:MFS transporter [Candidatus Aquilonibacter sp.]